MNLFRYNICVLAILFFAFTSVIEAQTPTWLWSEGAGGYGDDKLAQIEADANGNVFITGVYTNNDLDIGDTTLAWNSTAFVEMPFMAKYDANGNFQWALTADTGNVRFNSIDFDSFGNIVVAGFVYSFTTTPIVIGTTVIPVLPGAFQSMFIAKFDPNGSIIWGKVFGGSGGQFGQDTYSNVVVDNMDNIIVGGAFNSAMVPFGMDTVFFSGGLSDIFIAKLNPMGNPIWAKNAACNDYDQVQGLDVDNMGNIYFSGYFAGISMVMDNVTMINPLPIPFGNYELFTIKLDPMGTAIWGVREGGIDHDYSGEIAVDDFGNVYHSWYTLSPFVTVGANTYPTGAYLLKYNSSGVLEWSRKAGDLPGELAVDGMQNVYLSGRFSGNTIDIGGIVLNNLFPNSNSTDIFLGAYNPSGTGLWGMNFGGTDDDYAEICVDPNDNFYVGGNFISPSIQLGTNLLTNINIPENDIFLGKIDVSTSVTNIDAVDYVEVFPNPANSMLSISLKKEELIESVELYDLTGRLCASEENNSYGQFDLDVSKYSSGQYIVKILTSDGLYHKSIVIDSN